MSKTKPTAPAATPTSATYSGFDKAHAYFNGKLFGGQLPLAMMSMQRHPNSKAYFSGERFMRSHGKGEAGKHVDEIAMNPLYFDESTVEDILSTLVHEMAHEWQHWFGKRPSRCYHDREWAAKMKSLGLQPSDTGLPGGKETGPKMTHYILPGGPFASACAEYLKDKANEPELYQDRARALAAVAKKRKPKAGDDGEEGDGEDETPKSIGRQKFTCLGCKLNAWAKPSAKLRCDDCDRPLRPADTED